MHTGSRGRIMPSYRFATAEAHKFGVGASGNLHYRTAVKFPPTIRVFLEKRTRPQTMSMTMLPLSDDHNQLDMISPPAEEITWGHRVCLPQAACKGACLGLRSSLWEGT